MAAMKPPKRKTKKSPSATKKRSAPKKASSRTSKTKTKKSTSLVLLNDWERSKVPELSSSNSSDLQTYLQSLRRYPLLSPEREKEVAVDYYENKSESAARILVLANLRLVVKIASDYMRSGITLLDLIQEGNIGLLQAVKEYDPYRGVKFSSYASYWIKAYIRSYILKNWSLVKMGTTRAQRALFYRLQKEKSQLEAMGITPETRYLAEKFNVKEKEVDEMTQRLSGRDLSLNTPIDSGEPGRSSSLLQTIEDPSEGIDEVLAEAQILREFEGRLESFERSLSGKELVVFRERLRSENPKTLQEIGTIYGITRERVRQIEVRVLEKLKEYMKKNASFMKQTIDI